MVLLSAAFLLSFAQNKPTSYTLSIYDVFDTYSQITIYAGSNGNEILQKCSDCLYEADALWSYTDPESEISMLNSQAGKEPVQVSDATFNILDKALQYSVVTNGYFDITVGALSSLWDIGGENQHVPSREEISSAIHNTGFNYLRLDKESKTAQITKEGVSLTLGGIAKGYAAAELCELLKGENVTSAIIDLGGNIYTMGSRPDSSAWNIGIRDPNDSEGLIGTLNLFDTSIITSGSYIRYFEEDGTVYHHILNPFTGMPASTGLLSVTIISPDASLADALSTACFVIGYEESISLIEESGAAAVFVTDDNIVYYSSELESRFVRDNPNYEYISF